jgi:uncharacterized membrane protein YhaH (DUF805 family)
VAHLSRFLFSFLGRINRHDWWLLALIGAVLLAGSRALPQAAGALMALLALVVHLSSTARRLHDLGYSGWFALGTFVPIVGPVVVCVFCGFLVGESGSNQHGPPPPRTQAFAS